MPYTSRRTTFLRLGLLPLAIALVSVGGLDRSATADQEDSQRVLAQRILKATGVQGGLVVHLGCGTGELTAALRAGKGYLVHGLDTNADHVEAARRTVRSLGLYGPVSIDRLDGRRLPYVDNLVNLVVAEDLGSVSMEEVTRVLCPNGAAYVKQQGKWVNAVKPRPAEIDEWTHFLHSASNNAVSNDSVVGPPRQLQWTSGPKWARSHDHLASISACVSSGGRIFTIVDEGPTAAVVLEPKWTLIAQDAFNGVILWKRRIPNWQWHLRGFRSGPSEIARRLVAVGDRVYVTLDVAGPLRALDAATGKTLRTYEGTEATLEFVHHEGTLYVAAGDPAGQEAVAKAQRRGKRPGFVEVRSQRPAYREPPPAKRLLAIEAETGRLRWKRSDADTVELMPTTLAASGRRVFFQTPAELLCLDANSGEDIWRADRPTSPSRPAWSAPTLVVFGDVVLSADRATGAEKTGEADPKRRVEWIVSSAGGRAPVGELIAFSVTDGRRLWSTKCKECYNAPVDVLVAGGLVWTGELVRANEPGITRGLDPKTGQPQRKRPKDQEFFACGMGHGRCYRNKATQRYLVLGRSGVEFVDVATGRAIPNHWTRGTCQYGVMPCNGLLYVPSNSCACFITSKLSDFNCFAPERAARPAPDGTDRRPERGPAYSQIQNPKSQIPNPADWPTYRHDSARSGRTATETPSALEQSWQTDLGGKLSAVVISGGKLFVAQIDAHTVHALRADSGEPVWSFTAGGRVDSPPSIWQGRVLFGSADGWVYCLRASDGALAWRLRAAPSDRRIVSHGQLESAWPVHGNVLVHDGAVYCAAGRSSYLDGGIRLLRLDAKTGKLLSETAIDHRDPETGYQRQGVVRGTNMPGALPDVLSCDGRSVFMRHLRFDAACQPQEPNVPHLYSAAGFVDDAWWHRTYWMLGTTMGTNYGGWPNAGNRMPAGRLLVVDEDYIYGFGRNQYIHHGAHVGIDGASVFHFRTGRDDTRRETHYRAFAISRKPKAVAKPAPKKVKPPAGKKAKPPKRRRRPPAPPKQYRWTENLPILGRAMILAKGTLFVAGPPELFAADDPVAALEGRRGGLLCVMSADDGKQVTQYELDAPPVFDGMAAAGGRLYMATTDGKVLCFAGRD